MFCNCQSFSSFRLMSTLLDHQMNLSHFLKLFCSLLLRFNHCIFNFSCLFRIQLLFASITSPFPMLICLLFISSFLFYIFVFKKPNFLIQHRSSIGYLCPMLCYHVGCPIRSESKVNN